MKRKRKPSWSKRPWKNFVPTCCVSVPPVKSGTWGGPGRGGGRPATVEAAVKLSLRLSAADVKKLDDLAQQHGLTRTDVIRGLLSMV